MTRFLTFVLVSYTLLTGAAQSGDVDVEKVNAIHSGNGVYTFHVMLRHADTGWEHYADRWDVATPDGKVLGSRKLLHPHVDEQPFTRSLSGIRVPAGTKSVTIRAHDKVHGEGGREITVLLSGAGG